MLLTPVRDVLPAVEVFALHDYDIPVIVWDDIKSVVDCGANVGTFALWVAQKSACRILAVEPDPRTFALLERNVAGLAHRVSLLQAAVAGHDGTRMLYARAETSSSSFFGAADSAVRQVHVQTLTLADVLRRAPSLPIDLLKIDIEGAEYEVFQSCDTCDLAQVRVAIVECHSVTDDDLALVTTRLGTSGMTVAVERRHGTGLVVAWR
ncbi:MAG: FkbM family methyltransferase [Dehalococcoidia bacterium]